MKVLSDDQKYVNISLLSAIFLGLEATWIFQKENDSKRLQYVTLVTV